MTLSGRFRLTEPGQRRRTAGKFAGWMRDNQEVLRRYFGVELFFGSVNVDIDPAQRDLHLQLDRGHPKPALVIPKTELQSMEIYLGNAQAWRAQLSSERLQPPLDCWVLRRIGSRVPGDVIEIVSVIPVVKTYGVRNGEPLELVIF